TCALSIFFFFSGRRRHTRSKRDWSSDVCSSDLAPSGGDRRVNRPKPGKAHAVGCRASETLRGSSDAVAVRAPPFSPATTALARRSEARRVGKEGRVRLQQFVCKLLHKEIGRVSC